TTTAAITMHPGKPFLVIMTSFVLFVNSIHTDGETTEHTMVYPVDYIVEEPPSDEVPSSETSDSEQIAEFEPAELADESEWHSNFIEDPDSREFSPGTTDSHETADLDPTKPANKFIEYQFTDGSSIAPCLLSICILAISLMINFI
uniref:Conserved plasma membrane protein n=1 Tax=Haemonchus contortus TaxID=6289 RepID=A0A7I4YNH6_HAECO